MDFMDEQQQRRANEAAEPLKQVANPLGKAGERSMDFIDEQQQRRANEAAEQFADAVRASFQAVSERGTSAQELNAELTEQFFNTVIGNLRTQAEDTRQLSQQLADQQQRTQEATRTIAQESVGAYMEFLNSLFSLAPGRSVQGWDASKHPRDSEGHFQRGEVWDESEHHRDAGGRFT
jgi:ABC-type transporter Mla subunit MlaD